MKKLIAIILIITTFLAMTSCDKKDDKEENLDKENVVLYEEIKNYYTHYTAPIRDITELPTTPRFLNTYEEFVEFSTQYTDDNFEKFENIENIVEHTKLENITEQTFKDYFIVAVLDPVYQHIEVMERRTYSGFTVYNDTLEFYIKSYYHGTLVSFYIKNYTVDFVLVPRKLYSEDLKEKQINMYVETYYGKSQLCYECYQYNTDGTKKEILIYQDIFG